MAKKVIYHHREREQLFLDYMREKYPDYDDIKKKLVLMTGIEQNTIFLEICNKYGEDGWIINPIPYQTRDGNFYYLMYKEVYYNKKEKETD